MGRIYFEDIKEMVKDYENMPRKSSNKPLPDTHIFDEDKSVKWNKEEVLKYNESITAETAKLQVARNDAYFKITKLGADYVKQELPVNITNTGARHLFNQLYCMEYSLDEIDEILNVVCNAFAMTDGGL